MTPSRTRMTTTTAPASSETQEIETQEIETQATAVSISCGAVVILAGRESVVGDVL